MFVPVGRNTLIFIPMVRHHNQNTETSVKQPPNQTNSVIIEYGAAFVAVLMFIAILIGWYDSTHR